MAEQMKVKPTSSPILPATFTQTTAAGDTVVGHLGAGVQGKAFDPRVNEYGDQWVWVNGTVVTGGIGPNGQVIPVRVDGLGNPLIPAPNNSTSVAYEASRFVKSGPGVLYGLSGYNSKASTQFILLIDYGLGVVPANATVPFVIIGVAATSNFSYDPGRNGRAFGNGLWVANSSTGPTLTIGSADCWFDVQFS